jgi:hypothetical protein
MLPGRPFLCVAGGNPSGIPRNEKSVGHRMPDTFSSHSSSGFPHQLRTVGTPSLSHRLPSEKVSNSYEPNVFSGNIQR